MDRYDQNSFYYSITDELWCWKQTSSGKIYKAKSKSELLKIKEKQFVGSGNYEREYNYKPIIDNYTSSSRGFFPYTS